MSSLLADAEVPGEVLEVIQELVSRAGYDLGDESELVMGMTAALATLRVCDALRTRRVPRDDRVGRNDPCPCGSGKKHKKCCLRTGAPGPGPERYDPGDPLERPDLVPRFHVAETLAVDLGRLEELFCADETLREVRFTPEKLVAFLLAEAPEANLPPPSDDPEEEDLEGERRVARYLREVEGIEALGNLDRALLRAARDSAECDQDVRSLAAGLALTELAAATDGNASKAPSPLLSLLFWLTLRETVAGFSAD